MQSTRPRKWLPELWMVASFALVACSDNGSGGGSGTGGNPVGSGGSAGRSSQASSTGGLVAPSGGNGGTTVSSSGVPGSGGAPATGQGGAGTGGAGKGGAAGGSGGSAQGGAAGATVSSSTGGKPGSGGASLGGTTGAGGITSGGGSGGSRDAGSGRDGGGADGNGTGGANTGGSASGGSGTGSGGSGPGAGCSGGTGSGGKSGGGGLAGGSGGSGTGGTNSGGGTGGTSFVACPGATQTLTVGSGQQYATVQAAVNAVSSSNSKLVQISVTAGTYKEHVSINKPFVCLTGESPTTTTIAYTIDNNIVTGGTVLVTANDFSAANIAFENTYGQGASGGQNQAVALMAQGQRQQFRNCRFLSYQDTLYTNTGTQYFRDCFIQGSVDYIFGDATAVFENCTMNNIAEGSAVCAPRTPQNAAYGFVFLGGSLTAASSVRANHVYLGRPWGPYAAAAYLNVAMGAHIAADGWTTMSGNTLAETHFWEYKSTGAGANPSNATRASRQLSDSQATNYTVAKVLSSWTPGYSQ